MDISSVFTDSDLKKFEAGTFYWSYEKMGAHLMTLDGVEGVYFAVWAPNAVSVSVVGDFNGWNGTNHQMIKLGESGIFERFIPGLKAGAIYKFEVKTLTGELMLKSDPYAFQSELRPDTASVIWDGSRYSWKDEVWMAMRAEAAYKERPMFIYEVHLGSWIQKAMEADADGSPVNGSQFYNYRELSEKLASYVKEMGYTHVELMPVMEHPLDASWGYQTTGYYAPTSRYGTPDDFKAFIDRMHQEGIGVILDWIPSHFPKDAYGLAKFDGTCLYEHPDPRQGELPQWDTLAFHYGRPQVSNFLISSALYWAKEFHVDGIRTVLVDAMLYLDFGRNSGEWLANMYGSNENLDAVEFIKHLNSIFHRETQGTVMIAEESAAWPGITGRLNEGGLGFDYKWNSGWQNDFLRYLMRDPQLRYQNYGDLTFSMLYAYSEDFVHGFSHAEVVHGKGSMLTKMPGDSKEKKMANLRTAYGYLIGHPGKKHLFMGQEFGQMTEWNENRCLDWDLLQTEEHAAMKAYGKALNHLYLTQPALYERDFEPEGFEWVNCTYEKENMVIFIRNAKKQEDTLLFVCNFAPTACKEFRVGVPFTGWYKEILNSDASAFGGSGQINQDVIESEEEEKDHRKNSIKIHAAPMSVCIFQCIPKQAYDSEQKSNTEKAKNGSTEITSEKYDPSMHPMQTAKAAGDAIVKKGADALDRISERVGSFVRKNSLKK